MPTINVFVGGTGVRSAVIMRGRARFYKYDVGAVRALDTEPHQHGGAKAVLGRDLLVAEDGFDVRIRKAAQNQVTSQPIKMYDDSQPFGAAVVRAGSQTVLRYLSAGAGLYTLRSAGWLAMDDILQSDPNFIPLLASAVAQAVSAFGGQGVVVQIVASVAGGTGSGLFLPLIARLQQRLLQMGVTQYEVHLSLVLASAFEVPWNGAPDRKTRRTRGHGGSYAAMREIQYLTASVDDRVVPERRAIHGDLPRPVISRTSWFGRRDVDAASSAEETFYEVGRVLAVLNDDGFRSAVTPKTGQEPHTQMPSFNSLEYPKFEIAQQLAAQATVALLGEMLRERDGTSYKVLSLNPEQRGPLLTFIHDARQPPQILQSEASARSDNLPQARVVGPQGLLAACGISNTMAAAPKGNDLFQPSYGAPTHDAWAAYCARLFSQLEGRQDENIAATQNVLATQRTNATTYVTESMGAAIADATDPETGVPLLGLARQRIVELVKDFDIARLFFDRGAVGSVIPPGGVGRKLVPSEQQRAEVVRHRSRLVGNLQKQAPQGWKFSWGISILFFLIGLVALIGYVARVLPPMFGAASWGGEYIGSVPPEYLLIGFIIGMGLFGLHRWWVGTNWKQLPQVRREAEADLVRAWEWYVTCRQAELLWASARDLCQGLVGVPGDRTVSGVASPPTPVGRCFTLLGQANGWLDELRNAELEQLATAGSQHRTVVREIRPVAPLGDLKQFWPTVRISPRVGVFGGQSALVDLVVEPSGDETSALSVQDWQPTSNGPAVNRLVEASMKNRGNGFLTAIEEAVRLKVGDGNILPDTLEDVINGHPEYDGALALATRLEELAQQAQQRGAPGTLTPAPAEAHSFIVVPDQTIAARVRAALNHAAGDPGRYIYLAAVTRSTEGRIIQTPNVDQAIALVQYRAFAWPGVQGPQLLSLEQARQSHYAIGGSPSGDPQVTEDYNAHNTEFYLLPEPSAAAAIEVRSGSQHPLPLILQQRLYGSHLAVGEVPTLIDLFYLADVQGMFRLADEAADVWADQGIPVPHVAWYLVESSVSDPEDQQATRQHGLPLVKYATVGNPAGDPFGAARERMILFDAFLTAMSYRGAGIGEGAIPVFLVKNAQMLAEVWAQPHMYERLERMRFGLVGSWFGLRAKGGRDTYARMAERALADAHAMPQGPGRGWETITRIQFAESRRNLGIGD